MISYYFIKIELIRNLLIYKLKKLKKNIFNQQNYIIFI